MRKNILVLLIDGCRADRLGCYGYTRRDTSPIIDALAASAFKASRNYATSFCTIPSVVSAFTGVYPCVHRGAGTWSYYDGAFPFLTDILRRHGYQTFGVANNAAAMSPEWGFIRGYDRFYRVGREHNWFKESKEEQRGVRKPSAEVRLKRSLFAFVKRMAPTVSQQVVQQAQINWYEEKDRGGRRATDATLRALDERDPSKPFFGYVNLPDTHSPYLTIKEFARTWGRLEMTENLLKLNLNVNKFEEEGLDLTSDELESLQVMYDCCVRYSDHLVEEIVTGLKARGLFEDTAIVIMGDHGGNTWEKKRRFGAASFTYEEEIRVPMIIANGGIQGTTAALTTLIDLFPTLLEVSEVSERFEPCHGRSLFSATPGHQQVLIDYPAYPDWLKSMCVTTPSSLIRYGHTNRTMVTTEGSKLIWLDNGCHERYDLNADPREAKNLFAPDAEGLALIERLQDVYASLVGPVGRHLEIYDHADIGDQMQTLPPISIVNPGFDPGSVMEA